MASFLFGLEQITKTKVFIDRTKIEANAGRCTFVWKRPLHSGSKGIEAFINPANYEQRGTKKLTNQIGRWGNSV